MSSSTEWPHMLHVSPQKTHKAFPIPDKKQGHPTVWKDFRAYVVPSQYSIQ